MCGILGSINLEVSKRQLDLIGHRGPDDSDLLVHEVDRDKLYFGHVRLAIQDLSLAGHQPMYSACGDFLIIFNGEIYNHLELRKDISGVDFKGHSDTETIVNYLAKFGTQSSDRFNGIFSFAFFDIKKNKLFLVRDRFGVKPLYFSLIDNGIAYSSELKPLMSLFDLNLSKNRLATLLKLRYNPSPQTLFTSVDKLRPGHVLEFDLASYRHSITSYISSSAALSHLDFDEALAKYGALFEQSVKRQLLADVEVGILLSGGIDSALVAYFAQKYSDKPIKTFTIGFNEDDDSNELADARETAKILGTDHHEVVITEDQFEDAFKKCIDIVEEPLGTTSIIPMYFLNRLVSEHVKVVLTGQGADEPLGGYTRYRGEMLGNRIPRFVFGWLMPLLPIIKKESVYRAISSLSEGDTVKRFAEIYSLFSDKEINALIGVDESDSIDLINYFYTLLDGQSKSSVNAMMSNDLRMNLSDDLLLYTDKISMHFSIESRVPMLDNDLVDFIGTLPCEYKINGSQGKFIHKKFAESILPKEIIYRKKKGFKSPTEKWFKGSKGQIYKSLLQSNTGLFSQIFDLGEIGNFFDIHFSGKRNMEKQLFILISIYCWTLNHEK